MRQTRSAAWLRREWFVIGLAVAARLVAIGLLQSHHVPRSTYEHGEIAANLLAGRGFSIAFLGSDGPTSQQAPVYPLAVAAAYAVGGLGTPAALLLLFAAQAILGGVMAWGTMRLARELLPGRPGVALASGGLVALHPTLVYAATHVQVASLAATLLVLVLLAAIRAGRTGRAWDAAGLGGLLGVLALTDPILILSAPATAWLAARGAGPGRNCILRTLGAAAVVGALTLAPWVARNWHVHGQFVPIKSTFGYAFWQGNCRLSAGTDKVVRGSVSDVLAARLAERPESLASWNSALWAARHEAGYIDDIALTNTDKQMLGRLPEPERSRVLFGRALADLRVEPGRYPRLCLARLWAFLLFDETNPKTRHWLYRAGHLVLSGLALLGWLLVGRAERWSLLPTLLVFWLLALFHALTIVSARFHIPVEPLMAIWAGAGMGALARLCDRRGSTAAADRVVRVGIERGLCGGAGGESVGIAPGFAR